MSGQSEIQPDEGGPGGRAVLCPKCRTLTAGGAGRCPSCGARLGSNSGWRLVGRGIERLNFTKAIAGACVTVYFLSLWAGRHAGSGGGGGFDLLSPSIEGVYIFGLQGTAAILERHEYWRLLTAVFVHLGPFHILMNLLALNFVGGVVEADYGAPRYIQIFAFSGLASGLGSLVLGQNGGGASGAVFGLIGAAAVYGHVRGGEYGRSIKIYMLKWGAACAVLGFLIPGVNNAAHLSGFAGGVVWGFLVNPEKGPLRSSRILPAAAALALMAGSAAAMIACAPSSKIFMLRMRSLDNLSRAAGYNDHRLLLAAASQADPKEFATELEDRAKAMDEIRTYTQEATEVREGIARALEGWASKARSNPGGAAGEESARPLAAALDRFAEFAGKEAARLAL